MSQTREKLLELMQSADADVASFSPRCEVSGRCCRFAEYGHTLFLSAIEADFLCEVPPPVEQPIDRLGCPYQVDGLCMARERRPLACRIYYCDPSFAEKQGELSEGYIRRLKQLHEELGLSWSYRPLFDHLAQRIERPAGSGRP